MYSVQYVIQYIILSDQSFPSLSMYHLHVFPFLLFFTTGQAHQDHDTEAAVTYINVLRVLIIRKDNCVQDDWPVSGILAPFDKGLTM